MVLTSTSVDPTVFGLGGDGGVPSAGDVVVTYPMAASASVSAGDFVKLTDTEAGTVERCTASGDAAFGIAKATIDNSDGAASDAYLPVLRQGFEIVDGVVAASGTYNEPIRFNDALYLTGSAVNAIDPGQTLTSTTDTGVGTTIVARAMDAVDTPSSDYTRAKIRVYVDFLNKAMA
jgi:hypothetical protein